MELVKNYGYNSVKSNITYYRDANAKEIDLFVEESLRKKVCKFEAFCGRI